MKCQNKEKFDYSNILFEPIIVHDSEGKDIFKLNSYTNTESLSCDISLNSVPTTKNSSEFEHYYNSPMKKTGSKGLSGGSITAIVLSIVVALVAIAIIFYLTKSDICLKNKTQIHTSIQSLESKSNMNPKYI